MYDDGDERRSLLWRLVGAVISVMVVSEYLVLGAATLTLRALLVCCPRDGFTASVDPGPAAGVLAPPSFLRPRRGTRRVCLATPRRSSLRSPASAPGSAVS